MNQREEAAALAKLGPGPHGDPYLPENTVNHSQCWEPASSHGGCASLQSRAHLQAGSVNAPQHRAHPWMPPEFTDLTVLPEHWFTALPTGFPQNALIFRGW